MKYFICLLVFTTIVLNTNAQTLIVQETINSEILGQKRKLNIIMPDTINGQQWNGKMNVVFVLDGFDKFANLIASNFSLRDPAFLVVGVESEDTRRDDFFMQSNFYKTGRADKFISFLSDELFPFIESRYKVTKHRVGIGHSLGGSLMLRALSERDSLFSAYFLISPNLVEGPLLDNFAQKFKNTKELNKFIYVAIGDTGMPETRFKQGVLKFDSLISHSSKRNGLHIEFNYLTDAEHYESLPLSIGRAVKSYFNYTYCAPNDSIGESLLSETDYAAAIKRHYEDYQTYMNYLYYPDVYGFYNTWIDFANERKQFNKALQAVNMAIDIHKRDAYQYFLYLAKADIYKNLKDKKSALEACGDALKSLQSVRDQYVNFEEDYRYCEEEIADKIAEIKN